MNGRTYRRSARIERSGEALTAGARDAGLSYPQEQTARGAVGREVGGVEREICKFPVYDTLEEVRRRRVRPPRVHYAGVEIVRSLPVRREVPEERRLQQRAPTTVLAPSPRHIVRAPDLHTEDAGRA